MFLGLKCFTCHAQQFVAVPPSSRYYGQDGPWGAVTVNYGGYPSGWSDQSQWTPIDLLPGGTSTSFVISPMSCRSDSTGLCGTEGTAMMTNVDQTLDNVVIEFTPYAIDNADSGVYMFGNIYAQTMNVGWSDSSLGATAYTTSTAIVDNMYYITPSNENTTAVEVGYLALGAGDDKGGTPTQQFGSTQWPIVTWNLPGYF